MCMIIFYTCAAPWSIQRFRRVCQVVPTNYEGHFRSSDETLTKIWWTGAYTARVTMVGNGLNSHDAGYLGSELKDRGDRIAFLGDAHATQVGFMRLSLTGFCPCGRVFLSRKYKGGGGGGGGGGDSPPCSQRSATTGCSGTRMSTASVS
jgi:hypothetical protein